MENGAFWRPGDFPFIFHLCWKIKLKAASGKHTL